MQSMKQILNDDLTYRALLYEVLYDRKDVVVTLAGARPTQFPRRETGSEHVGGRNATGRDPDDSKESKGNLL